MQKLSPVRNRFAWTEVRANALACALVIALVLIPSVIGVVVMALVARLL